MGTRRLHLNVNLISLTQKTAFNRVSYNIKKAPVETGKICFFKHDCSLLLSITTPPHHQPPPRGAPHPSRCSPKICSTATSSPSSLEPFLSVSYFGTNRPKQHYLFLLSSVNSQGSKVKMIRAKLLGGPKSRLVKGPQAPRSRNHPDTR